MPLCTTALWWVHRGEPIGAFVDFPGATIFYPHRSALDLVAKVERVEQFASCCSSGVRPSYSKWTLRERYTSLQQ
jgi:hypothetical protein